MTQAHICHDGYAKTETVHCDDCDWAGTLDQVEMITDIEERISPGEIVPAGQCPECGALAHLDEAPAWSVAARLAKCESKRDALLAALQRCIPEPLVVQAGSLTALRAMLSDIGRIAQEAIANATTKKEG